MVGIRSWENVRTFRWLTITERISEIGVCQQMWDVGSELYVITCSEFCVYQVDPLVLWQKYGTFDALEVHVSMTIWVVTTTCLVWVMYWVLMHWNLNFGTLWDLWRGGHKFVLTQYNCCLLAGIGLHMFLRCAYELSRYEIQGSSTSNCELSTVWYTIRLHYLLQQQLSNINNITPYSDVQFHPHRCVDCRLLPFAQGIRYLRCTIHLLELLMCMLFVCAVNDATVQVFNYSWGLEW